MRNFSCKAKLCIRNKQKNEKSSHSAGPMIMKYKQKIITTIKTNNNGIIMTNGPRRERKKNKKSRK
jgi:hypothetical protein